MQDRLDAISLKDAETIYAKLLGMALTGDGDLSAIKMILDRAWPTRRGATTKFAMGSTRSANEIGLRMDEVIAAVARGELTVEEGEKLTGMLSQRMKAIETIELAQEIAELRALAAGQLQLLTLPAPSSPSIEMKQVAAAHHGAVPVYAVQEEATQP